jgi:hypothetical protein
MAGLNTVTSRRGFGNGLMGAIIGVPLGLLLIFGSSIFLYVNEGRTDYSKIAEKSTPINATAPSNLAKGTLVSVSGTTKSEYNLGDGDFLKAGPYIALTRTVEEYAWVENQQTNNNNTTYSYSEQWTADPADSSSFHQPQGHNNPSVPIDSTSGEATTAKIGNYVYDPQTIKLPKLQNLELNSSDVSLTDLSNDTVVTPPVNGVETVTPAAEAATTVSDSTTSLTNVTLANSQYLYAGRGNINAPSTGDVRISYQVLPSGTYATVFGSISSGGTATSSTIGSIDSYTNSNNKTLYDILYGGRQTAIATLHSHYEKTVWISRGIGLALIWLGLIMLFGPLDYILDFIPIAGQIGNMIVTFITFPVALVLGGTVIMIGYTAHHLIALIIAIPIVVAFWIGVFKLVKKVRKLPSKNTPPQPPAAAPGAPPTPPVTPAAIPPSGSLFPSTPTNSPVIAPTVAPQNQVQPRPIQQPITPTQSALPPTPPVIVQPQAPQVIHPTVMPAAAPTLPDEPTEPAKSDNIVI